MTLLDVCSDLLESLYLVLVIIIYWLFIAFVFALHALLRFLWIGIVAFGLGLHAFLASIHAILASILRFLLWYWDCWVMWRVWRLVYRGHCY